MTAMSVADGKGQEYPLSRENADDLEQIDNQMQLKCVQDRNCPPFSCAAFAFRRAQALWGLLELPFHSTGRGRATPQTLGIVSGELPKLVDSEL